MRLYNGLSGKEEVIISSTPDCTIEYLRSCLLPISGPDGGAVILLNQNGLTCRADELLKDFDVVFFFKRPTANTSLLPLSPSPPPSSAPEQQHAAPAITSTITTELGKAHEDLWHQWQQAQALLSQAEQIAQSTLELRQCIDRQVDAARCVAANLVHYYSALVHAVAVFQEEFEDRTTEYEDLLGCFPKSLERLQHTPVHPSLGHTSTNLLGLLSADGPQLYAWHEKCRQEWARVHTTLSDLSVQLRDIKAAVELEKDDIESPVTTSVDERSLVDEQRGLVEQCENHFTTVSGALSAPGTPPDLSMFADLLRKFEERIRPKLSSNCQLLQDTFASLSATHSDMFAALVTRVRRIVQCQSRISSLQRKLPLYRKLMARLDEHFTVLRQCHHLPEAYQWGLFEVVRRRAFARVCLQKVAEYQEALGQLMARELRERERFHQQYGQFLGADVIRGLQEPLPCAAVAAQMRNQLQQFKSALPGLDTPEQVTSFFHGVLHDRALGDPPDSLLPGSLEQLIHSIPQAHAGPSHASLPPPALAPAPSTAAAQRIGELEAQVKALQAQLSEERELQVVAVEASSSSYLDTIQRIAQSTHFQDADLASPAGLQRFEDHVAGLQCSRDALLQLAAQFPDPQGPPASQGDPAAGIAALLRRVRDLQEDHGAMLPPHQRYRQALDSLLAMVGLPGVGRGEPIPFDHLEDLLGAVADLKEEHAVLKARTEVRGMSQKLISLGNFGLGDTVVFVHRRAAGHPPPTLFGSGGDSGSLTDSTLEGYGVFEAVHSGSPHWYLTEETTGGLFRRYQAPPPFVIVTVLNIEDRVAIQDGNPFHLPLGTVFHEVVGEWVYDPLRSDIVESGHLAKP